MLASAILHACGTTTASALGTTGGGGGAGLPFDLGQLATYAISMSILSVGMLTLVLIVVFSRRPRPRAFVVPAGATLSPDGYYWWDGAAWRPTVS
jgi:hypothetical protein